MNIQYDFTEGVQLNVHLTTYHFIASAFHPFHIYFQSIKTFQILEQFFHSSMNNGNKGKLLT